MSAENQNHHEALPPPSIEEQEVMLATVQMDHRDKLQEAGLIEEIAMRKDVDPSSHIFRVMKNMERHPEGDIEVLSVQIGKYSINKAGQESTTYGRNHAVIGKVLNGSVIPENGYTFDDVELVAEMIQEIKELRDQGHLPDLSENYTSIFDRRKALRAPRTDYEKKDSDYENFQLPNQHVSDSNMKEDIESAFGSSASDALEASDFAKWEKEFNDGEDPTAEYERYMGNLELKGVRVNDIRGLTDSSDNK